VAAVSRLFALFVSCCIVTVAIADDQLATSDYLIHCQGCHLPQAVGVPGHVPRMNNFLGYYLHSEAGRRFVIQVPGAATANLTDARLANLMNWLLLTYSEAQLPDNFKPYSVDEIARLRPNLEPDPETTRVAILQSIAADLPKLASEMESNGGY